MAEISRDIANTPVGPRLVTRRQLSSAGRRAPAASSAWVRVFRQAMAGRFEVTLDEQDARLSGLAVEALREAERLERAWSVFDDDSEVSRINRSAFGAPRDVDDELFALLQRCARLHAETGGAFDITSAPFSRCWGFLARCPAVPAASDLARAAESVGQHLVELNALTQSLRFARPGVSINLGSIGKGYAVGAIARRLRAAGVRHALVSASGSSIEAIGGRDGGWRVDVKPAGQPLLAHIRLRNAAMATSGAGAQCLLADGVRYGHVIDPRTGWPARGVLSATVVADDCATADALATACLINGVEFAAGYCDAHPRTLTILVPDDGPRRPMINGHHPTARLELL